jgi:hypothetical protein
MANTIQHATQNQVVSAVNTLQSWNCTGGIQVDSGATETNAQTLLRSPGTASFLFFSNTANGSTAGLNVTFRVNAANGNQVVTVTTGATGIWEDTTHTDAITAGQQVNVQVGATTGASTTITVGSIGYLFAATTNTVTRLCTSPAMSALVAATTYFSPLAGFQALNTTENRKCRQQKAGTLLNLACNVSTASASTTHSLVSRKGAVTQTQTVTCTAATTGWFEDTTHTDTVAVADDWDISLVTGATSLNLVIQQLAVDFSTTTGIGQEIMAANSGQTFNVSANTFMAIEGGIPGLSTTEANLQRTCRAAFTFSNLTCLIQTNTVSAQTNLNFRNNAAAVNQTVPVTASTIGVFTDSTHTDVVVATDKVDLNFIAGGTGTSVAITIASVWSTLATTAIPLYLQPVFMEWIES